MTIPYELDTIAGFAKKRVLIIGDTMLDVYLNGQSTRLCPEAPVPIVDLGSREVFPGGSANTVCNFHALGATADFMTVIGTDGAGDEAIELLTQKGISTRYILRTHTRKTIVKTRVMSGAQTICRLDEGSTEPIDQNVGDELCSLIEQHYQRYDAIILSDYAKGVITDQVVTLLQKIRSARNTFIAIDSKRLHFFKKLEPSFVKPNYQEAIQLLGEKQSNSNRVTQIIQKSGELFNVTCSSVISVTLDDEGAIVFEKGELIGHLSASKIQNPQVAGAGDTYLAAFVLSQLVTPSTESSAKIASAAASVAVSKAFTSTCSSYELQEYFCHKHIFSFQQLASISAHYHDAGKKVVFTNGCFDILHSGHVSYLQQARALGDVLIVGVNDDASIRRLKGETRPVNALTDRLQVLEGLACVTHVVAFGQAEDDTPTQLIDIVRPHIFVKGGDYSKEMLPEASSVEKHGGIIHFIPHVANRSTTSIIKRINRKTSRTMEAEYGQLERL